MRKITISDEAYRLLDYIATYLRLHQDATRTSVAEELILAYGKQLLPGVPEKLWEDNMRLMIKECEDEHEEKRKQNIKTIKQIEARARTAERKAKRLQARLRGHTVIDREKEVG